MKIILTLSFVGLLSLCQGQNNFYQAYKTTSGYDTLQGSTKVTSTINPNNAYSFKLAKSWSLFNEAFDNDTLSLVRNGILKLKGDVYQASLNPCLANLEIKNDPSSGIFVKETPQKLSAEWRNITLPGQPSGSYLNFQIHIYANQVFEFQYGPSNLNATNAFGGSGPTVYNVAYTLDFQQTLEIHSVGGDPSNPTFYSVNGQTNRVTAFPDSGTVYRFEPKNLSDSEVNLASLITFYPNPVISELHSTEPGIREATLFSTSGVRVKKLEFVNARADMTDLAPGTYFLKAATEKGTFTKLIVKQ